MSNERTRQSRFVTTIAAAVVTIGTLITTPLAAGAATDPCNGNWAPVLRGYTVNQGLGTYTNLARGKKTLVRLFLSAPSCAPDSTVQLVDAQLFTSLDNYSTAVPTLPATLGPQYPTLTSYSAARDNLNAANVTFVIPSIDGLDTSQTAVSISFKATFDFQYRLTSNSTTWFAGPAQTVTTPLGSSTAMHATIAPPSLPLRLLVVPMGNASVTPRSTEFPERKDGVGAVNGQYADTVVQNAMASLARQMPVADGVADLASTSKAGLLYRLDDQNIIDLGPNGLNAMTYGNGSQFCLTGQNFAGVTTVGTNISSRLTNYLANWNSAPGNPQADAVLGVVWQTISVGSSDPAGCAEGMAAAPGAVGAARAAVIRLVADGVVNGTTAPSVSGALAGMEVSHLWGDVPKNDPRDTAQDFHSMNQTADPTGTGTGYNLDDASWLPDVRSTMRYTGYTGADGQGGVATGWNRLTAVFEKEDYQANLCARVPSMDPSQCPVTIPPGAAAASGNANTVELSGSSDGTKAGTIIHSYVTDTPTDVVETDPVSTYRLIEKDPTGAVIDDYGVPTSSVFTDHDGALPALAPPTGTVTISAAMPADQGIASFELWNGEPGVGTFLYGAAVGPRPVITSTSGGASLTGTTDYTNVAGNETTPALSADGTALAWVTTSGITVSRRDPSTNSPAAGTSTKALALPSDGATAVAWSPIRNADGSRTLAYSTASGDVYQVNVKVPATGGASFSSTPVKLYDHLVQTPPSLGTTAASHPSYSPDGSQLAVAINGNIWRVTTANAVICDLSTLQPTSTCVLLASDGNGLAAGTNAAPSWSSVAAGNLVAFQKGSDIYTVPGAGGTPTKRISNASAPSWGSNLLAYIEGTSIFVADTSIVAGDGSYPKLAQLTSSSIDGAPALSGDAAGIAFQRATLTNGQDIFDASISSVSPTLTFSATTTGDAHKLTADLYDYCGNAYAPILDAVPPTSVSADGRSASWSIRYDTTYACPGSAVSVRLTDGYNLSAITVLETVPAAGPDTPPAVPSPAIGVPVPGSTYLQYDVVLASASSISATGTNASVQTDWLLTGPTGSGYNQTALSQFHNSTTAELDPNPKGGGWVVGPYSLTYRVTDSSGTTSDATTSFTVLPDPQHLGRNIRATFNPQTLYVPSSGTDVTITITPNGQDLSKITPSTVHISQVGAEGANIPVDTASGTTGWTSVGGGVWQAKFSRQALTCFMNSHGLTGGYVDVAVSATGAAGLAITGFDPIYPNVTPATSPVAC